MRRAVFPTTGALALAAVMAGSAAAGSFTHNPGGGRFTVGVTSLKEQKFEGVVPQQYDFSCGSAALATLLTHHYDTPTRELPIFKSMLEHGDKEKIRAQGFSLLDMKKALARRGFKANGYDVPLAKLEDVGIPAVALINVRGYKHFVVIKGLTENRVLVGDPALGMKVWPREKFTQMWNGLLFVITSEMKIARASFNTPEAWKLKPNAPLGQALTREILSQIRLDLPGPNEF